MQGDVLAHRDLKPLDDAQLLVLGARFVLRATPWRPPGSDEVWHQALADLVVAGRGETVRRPRRERQARAVLQAGAMGAASGAPEPLWRACNQAASALGAALDAVDLAARKDRWKKVVSAGKHVASVFAVQAHAGALPLADALSLPWQAARADIEAIAAGPLPQSVDELRALGPLWPGDPPSWITPSP